MFLRKLTASIALAAVAFSLTAAPALAGPPEGKGRPAKVSQKFADMSGFEWGLSHVVKMQVKGVFKGRDEKLFAPGAKITRQEAAVAAVRLLNKEAEAGALTATEVTALLAGVPDHASIASWARSAVAYLIQQNSVSGAAAFGPQDDATRLYVAVLLVKALGLNAEAQAKMGATLAFKDAHLIPADMVGYVAAAVDHKLITGYEDRTFKPEKAVKRIEMAVMMGRADGLLDRKLQDEVKGTVSAVSAASSTLTLTVQGRSRQFAVAAEAAIFVDGLESELSGVLAGMRAELKLNADGKVIYLEAKTAAAADVEVPVTVTATGSIAVMAAPTASATGSLVLVSGSATTTYTVASNVAVTLNGSAANFAALAVGDQAQITVQAGLVSQIAVVRTAQVAGVIAALAPATATSTASLTLTAGATPTQTVYGMAATVTVTINGAAATFADLTTGDNATLTITGTAVTAVGVVRATVSGLMVSAAAATPQTVSLGSIVNGVFSMTTHTLRSDAKVTLNGQAATLAALQVNDSVTAALVAGEVFTLAATR